MNRTMASTRSNPSEDGFTLVEMVISILILGIILAPLLSSYVLGLGAATSTAQAVSNSSDAELVAGYFSADIAGATSVSPSDVTGTCGAGSTLIQTKSVDLAATGTPPVTYVSYVLTATTPASALGLSAGSVDKLERVTCNAAGAETGRQTLADTVKMTPPDAPVLLCDASTCTSGQKPQTVSLTLTEFEFEKLVPPTPTVSYTFTVNGERRVTA